MKKRFIAAGCIVALLSIGAAIFLRTSTRSPSNPILASNMTQNPIPPQPIVDMTKPKVLHIRQLGIESAIEEVGLEPNGDMATPPNNTNVGWYREGTIPGNAGRAVLAAHTGPPEAPTLFRKLELLKQGDSFQIEDSDSQLAEFEIIETRTYTPENAPLGLIFGPSATARVALITCTGTWIPQQKTYSHRFVAYAVRKG